MLSLARHLSLQLDALRWATVILILGLVVLSVTACRESDGPVPATKVHATGEDERIPTSYEADSATLTTNAQDSSGGKGTCPSPEADSGELSSKSRFPPVHSDGDPATLDASRYASQIGISLDEAKRRLDLQGLIGQLDAALSEHESTTFAGLWIEHTPRYRIVVQFTQDAQRTIAKYIHSHELAEVLEVRTAGSSLAELREAHAQAFEALMGEGITFDSGIDVKVGKVLIYVGEGERGRLDAAVIRGNVRLPDKVDVVTVPELSTNAQRLGRIPASSETDGPYPSTTIYFPQVREDRDVPDALLEGELVLKNGCLRSENPTGWSHLLIWPQRFRLSVDGRDIRIIGDSGVSLSIGDEISIGGGEVPLYHLQTLVEQPIPSDCRGPYWLVGNVPVPEG